MKIDITRAIIPLLLKAFKFDKNEKLSKKIFIYYISMNGGPTLHQRFESTVDEKRRDVFRTMGFGRLPIAKLASDTKVRWL